MGDASRPAVEPSRFAEFERWRGFVPLLCALGLLAFDVVYAAITIAEFGNYAPMTRRSWTLTIYYGGAAVFALALATGLFWALVAPAPRAPGVTAS